MRAHLAELLAEGFHEARYYSQAAQITEDIHEAEGTEHKSLENWQEKWLNATDALMNNMEQYAPNMFREFADGEKIMENAAKLEKAPKAVTDGAMTLKEALEQLDGKGKFSHAGRYDYSKSFAEQIDDFKNGKFPRNDTFIVGPTPERWKKVGFNALPVTIDQRHVNYVMNGSKDIDHHLGENLLKILPEAIKNPVAIIQSHTKPNRAVVILKMIHNGKTIILPVEVDGYGISNNLNFNSNAITSAYAKTDAPNQLLHAITSSNRTNIELFYWDKKEAVSLLQARGLQLPNSLPQDGFIHSIRDKSSKVKIKFNDFTETQQFQRWFGKSKAVNRNGEPMILYHRTNADFTTFDTTKSGSNQGRTHGDGIYLSSSPNLFDYAGDNIMELYAAVDKPFEMQLSEAEANKIYDKYFAPFHDDKYGTYKLHVINALMSQTKVFDYLTEAAESNHVNVSDILKELGYDGVHDGAEWVIFEPTKVKSATDNIGTFDVNNPDVRYSRRKQSNTVESLQEQNEKLREDYDRMKALFDQYAITGGRVMKTESPEKIAGTYREKQGAGAGCAQRNKMSILLQAQRKSPPRARRVFAGAGKGKNSDVANATK